MTPRTGYTGREGIVSEGRYFALWPSLKVNINPGLPNLAIGPVVPLGPNRSHGYLDYFFGSNVTDQWISDMFEFDNQVGAEDRILVESVQRGIRSGSLSQGRIILKSERLIAGFQRYILGALAGDSADR